MFEIQCLQEYDKSLDQESWPLLELRDACVYRFKRNGKDVMFDLLDVQDTGPFRVKGKLSPIPKDHSHIVYRGKASRLYGEELVVPGVTTYSIQALEDGTFNLWALGRCAWYSIVPSLAYAPIFYTALEKMQLWSFLQDRYLDSYSGAGEPIPGTVHELYGDYSRLRRKECPSAKAAERLFDTHHRYLLFEMCAAWTDAEMWARTPLYRDWALNYKREVEGIVRQAAAGSLEDRVAAGMIKQEVKEEEDDDDEDEPDLECVQEIARPRQYQTSKAPVKKVPAKKPPAKKTLSQTAAGRRAPSSPPPLRRAPSPTPSHITVLDSDDEDDDDNDDDNDDDEDDDEPFRRSSSRAKATPRPTHSSKGKSVLRPIRTPAPTTAVPDSDSDSEPSPRPKPTKRALDTSTTTSTSSSSKRTCTGAARAALSSKPTTSSSSSSSTTTTLRVASPLTAISTTTTTTTTTFISPITAIRPKTIGANRPGGLWECEIAGCRHAIANANTPENLCLVEQHYEEHGRVMRQAMEAIGGEVLPTRPKHHVDNLLAKIEAMAERWAMTKPAPLNSEENGF